MPRNGMLAVCFGLLVLAAPAAAALPDAPLFDSGFEHWQRHVADILGEPVRAPDPAAFDSPAALTLEGWFHLAEPRPRAWLMGKGIPINGGAGGVQLVYVVNLGDSGTEVEFRSHTFTLRAAQPLPLRKWTHLAAVMQGGVARLYVNGVLADTNPAAGVLPVAAAIPFGIGAPWDATGQASPYSQPGVHAQRVRAWSLARSGAELLATRDVWPLPAATPGLLGAWPLDDARGLVGRDTSANARTLAREVAVAVSHLDVLEHGPQFSEQVMPLPSGLSADLSDIVPIDFDSDGDLDLVLLKVRQPPTFPGTLVRQIALRNTNGVFADASDAVLGTLLMTNPRMWRVGDFNGDGRNDLFIAATGTDTKQAPGEQSRLLLQSTDGRLVDVSATHLPPLDAYTHGLGVADIEGDGDLDLLLANYILHHTPRLYINDGSAHFSDVSHRLPDDITSPLTMSQHPSAALCDVNGDGRADAVLGGNYYGPNDHATDNLLLMQDAGGNFVRNPAFTLPPKLHGRAGVTPFVACADLNGDGAPELLLATDVAADIPGVQLLLNNGAGQFSDASAQLNLDSPTIDQWYPHIHVVDINDDGLPDIVLRTNSQRFSPYNHSRSILLNRGNAHFVDASEVFIANTTAGVAVGDFDGDGHPDLLVPQSGDLLRKFTAAQRLSPTWFVD